jgi:cell shape-determining protein MreC
MKRTSYTPYLVLLGALLSVMSFSEKQTESLRARTVKLCSPFWDGVHRSKVWFAAAVRPSAPHSLEMEQLQLENEMLRAQIEKVREWLLFQERIDEQWERLQLIASRTEGELFWKEFFRRRSEELSELIDMQIQSLPARVVFREPASWSSSLWINVGERDNELLGKRVVSKNSPVILGTSLVGVVEYVGRTQSRVRLITDSGVVPAVRVIRGGEQDRMLLEHTDVLLKSLELREDLFSEETARALTHLKNLLSQESPERFLAKGELYGSSGQHLRTHSQVLQGAGFNYDFGDVEGSARDLRTGEAHDGSPPISLLKTGDLLVTSGLDGVFPPGLRVAIVTKIERLREGACSYALQARSTAGDLNDLTYLLVIPPVNEENPISSRYTK